MVPIRPLLPADASAYRELRLLALQESPTAFGSSYEQESVQPPEFFAGRIANTVDRLVLGAFGGDDLVGVVAFMRDSGVKTRHKGVIWGMYVHPDWRGKGIGRKLMLEILDRCEQMPDLRRVRLSVTGNNVAARKLYESLGFILYGVEVEALRAAGEFLPELHLVKTLVD
ncbi:MAG: GNAT family N-acetyltransferase [Cephaloticoccus sp.]|nr:GNAT family N-acetyltransferase [Cephaloticoccus sp.]